MLSSAPVFQEGWSAELHTKAKTQTMPFTSYYDDAAGVDRVERLKNCEQRTNNNSTVSLGSNYAFSVLVCWTNCTSRLDIIAFVWRQMNLFPLSVCMNWGGHIGNLVPLSTSTYNECWQCLPYGKLHRLKQFNSNSIQLNSVQWF